MDWPFERVAQHVCDTSCPLLRHHDYFFCCRNGNGHLCGELRCDRWEEQDDARVCTVTGISWALFIDSARSYEEERRAASAGREFQRTGKEQLAKYRPPAKHKVDTQGARYDPSACRPPSLRVAVAPPPARRATMIVAPNQESDDEKTVLRMLHGMLKPGAFTEARLRKLRDIIIQAWNRVCSVPAWDSKFTVEMCTIAVLYTGMQKPNGLRAHNVVCVAPEADINDDTLVALDKQPYKIVSQTLKSDSRKNGMRFRALVYASIGNQVHERTMASPGMSPTEILAAIRRGTTPSPPPTSLSMALPPQVVTAINIQPVVRRQVSFMRPDPSRPPPPPVSLYSPESWSVASQAPSRALLRTKTPGTGGARPR